jgi:hypothetical protein
MAKANVKEKTMLGPNKDKSGRNKWDRAGLPTPGRESKSNVKEGGRVPTGTYQGKPVHMSPEDAQKIRDWKKQRGAKANVKERSGPGATTQSAGRALEVGAMGAGAGAGGYGGYKVGQFIGKSAAHLLKQPGLAGVAGNVGGVIGAMTGAHVGGKAGHRAGQYVTKPMRRESTDISNFLKSLTEKNYAEANKYLHAVLDTKMKGRITDTVTS